MSSVHINLVSSPTFIQYICAIYFVSGFKEINYFFWSFGLLNHDNISLILEVFM